MRKWIVLLGLLWAANANAAITTRYFSTAAAGAGDGTTWSDRAALFDGSGNWSTVVTGFDFSANGLTALLGPGTCTCAQLLQGGTFTVAQPTVAHPLIVLACDSNGAVLPLPLPKWTAARPVWSTADMPVIACTTNTGFSSVVACFRLIRFTTSGRNGIVFAGGSFDWCVVTDSTSNSATVVMSGPSRVTNSVIQMTGTTFDAAIAASMAMTISNVRLEGNASATSGNRRGLAHGGTGLQADRLVVTGFPGGAVYSTSTNVAHWLGLRRFVLVNNPGTGYTGHSTDSQTATSFLEAGIICDNGTTGTVYGVNAGAEAIAACRVHLRDNYTANFTALGDWPTDLCDVDTSYGGTQAARQAALFVDFSGGDFRVKRTATAYWGKGFGVEDEAAVLTGDASYILTGTTLGGVAGNVVLPSVGDVQNGVTFGASSGLTGLFVWPLESVVKSGEHYGYSNEYTGTYAGGGGSVDFPDFCAMYGGG